MTLDAIIRTVTESKPESWHNVVCGGDDGPSFRDAFAQIDSKGPVHLAHDAHVYSAVYRPDVSITMAWGLEIQHRLTEDWRSAFAARGASRFIGDIFYNGALVFRESYLVIEGARAFIPLTGARDRSVTTIQYVLVKLIDELTHGENSEYVDYLNRIKVTIK